MTNGPYHYKESGLDTVYLLNGYEIVDTSGGKGVNIQDVEGLHDAIGRTIIEITKKLSGQEFRFLRTELLMSQAVLAKLLHVKELTVARWEKGQTKIPLSADATIRILYQEKIGGNRKLSELLQSIADIEDFIDRKIIMEDTAEGWDRAA